MKVKDLFTRNRTALVVFTLAAAWFLPGLWWGLPIDTTQEYMRPWGVDELGPWGAVDALLAIVGLPRNQITPQYPLAHFLVQALFVWPYYLPHYLATMYPSVAGKLGLSAAASPAVLVLLHRLPSLLMAAGTVTIAFLAARRLAGNVAGWVAAVATATIGPLVYYARTSNTDAPALFWTALALLFALSALRDGLTVRRAIAIGACAALGTATKDQQYAFFLGMGLVILAAHWQDCRAAHDRRGWWRAPLAGGVGAIAVYLVTSGILLLPASFARHVRFITRVPDPAIAQDVLRLADAYHSVPPTPAGYLELAANAGAQIVAAVGWPILLLAFAGIAYAARTNLRLLCLLLLPLVLLAVGVLAQVRLVLPRYLLPVDFVLCLFAGLALGAAVGMPRAARIGLQALAVVGLAWTTLHGADLTYQMLRDSRYEAGNWLERNIAAGDVVAYYGAPVKLPRLPKAAVVTPAAGQLEYAYERRPVSTPATPMFILSIPQLRTETAHEWTVTDVAYARLLDQASDYVPVLSLQTPALWPRPLLVVSFVNPPVRVFAHKSIVARLRDPPRIEVPIVTH